MTIREFVEGEYAAHIKSSLSVSTVDGYAKIYRSFGGYLDTIGFDAKVFECQKILRDICIDHPELRKTTCTHIKNYFSGVFSLALRLGYIEGNGNPWRVCKVPTAPEAGETYAYSADEITTMLSVLDMPYDLLVLFMASTGLRKSEARGVRWRDWNAETRTLSVEQAVWRKHVKNTKNASSKAPIPIVPNLAERLEAFRGKKSPNAFIFADSGGGPLDFDNAARRVIAPALARTKTQWHGFHAFRRGLATVLHAQGVPDKEIQAILRHGNISVTQACYVKTVPQNVREAMSHVSFGK